MTLHVQSANQANVYNVYMLSIYTRLGKLVRLANGVYLKTTITKFGPVYPSPTEIAEAIARRDHAQVLMSGLAAENYFGLSTQVPMKIVFLTSGSARKLTVGNTTIEFKRGVPKNFCAAIHLYTPSSNQQPWPIVLWLLPASLRIGVLFRTR